MFGGRKALAKSNVVIYEDQRAWDGDRCCCEVEACCHVALFYLECLLSVSEYEVVFRFMASKSDSFMGKSCLIFT